MWEFPEWYIAYQVYLFLYCRYEKSGCDKHGYKHEKSIRVLFLSFGNGSQKSKENHRILHNLISTYLRHLITWMCPKTRHNTYIKLPSTFCYVGYHTFALYCSKHMLNIIPGASRKRALLNLSSGAVCNYKCWLSVRRGNHARKCSWDFCSAVLSLWTRKSCLQKFQLWFY